MARHPPLEGVPHKERHWVSVTALTPAPAPEPAGMGRVRVKLKLNGCVRMGAPRGAFLRRPHDLRKVRTRIKNSGIKVCRLACILFNLVHNSTLALVTCPVRLRV